MANVRKRISELTALTSASLDTTLVGVDGGTTYKIELDTLADAVTSRVNILDRNRLNALESVTSSFETKGRSVISSSAQITSYGFISESVNITSLNSFTSSQSTLNTAFTNGISSRLTTSSFNTFSQSVDSRIIAATNEQSFNGLISGSSQLTSSYDDRYVLSGSITQTTWDNISGKPNGLVSQSTDLTSLNSFTSSQESLNTAFANGISSRLTTSSFNEYVASQSTSSLVNRLNTIESVSGSWITESETGSFLTNLNGAISSSSQLTLSFDERYTLSGSVQPLPDGLISGSSQLTSSYDTRYALSASFVSSSNLSSIQTITSASYAALTPVSGTLYIIIG
jgi:trimeric autotransporter adhesin